MRRIFDDRLWIGAAVDPDHHQPLRQLLEPVFRALLNRGCDDRGGPAERIGLLHGGQIVGQRLERTCGGARGGFESPPRGLRRPCRNHALKLRLGLHDDQIERDVRPQRQQHGPQEPLRHRQVPQERVGLPPGRSQPREETVRQLLQAGQQLLEHERGRPRSQSPRVGAGGAGRTFDHPQQLLGWSILALLGRPHPDSVSC